VNPMPTALDTFIYGFAKRRFADTSTKPTPAHSKLRERHERRARRVQAAILFILICIGSASFVEVVLIPGALVRRVLTADGTLPSEHGSDEQEATYFETAEARQHRDDIRRQRIETRLRDRHASLVEAIASCERARVRASEYCRQRLSLDLPSQAASIPTSLVPLIVKEQTAQFAWADLARVNLNAGRAVAAATSTRDRLAARIASRSYLESDGREIDDAKEVLLVAATELTRSTKADVDHLVLLLRSRAALARSAAAETVAGASP
jgi:hypothetical protein